MRQSEEDKRKKIGIPYGSILLALLLYLWKNSPSTGWKFTNKKGETGSSDNEEGIPKPDIPLKSKQNLSDIVPDETFWYKGEKRLSIVPISADNNVIILGKKKYPIIRKDSSSSIAGTRLIKDLTGTLGDFLKNNPDFLENKSGLHIEEGTFWTQSDWSSIIEDLKLLKEVGYSVLFIKIPDTRIGEVVDIYRALDDVVGIPNKTGTSYGQDSSLDVWAKQWLLDSFPASSLSDDPT